MDEFKILSCITFFPLTWALIGLGIPSTQKGWIRSWALIGSVLTFLLSLTLIRKYDPNAEALFQLKETLSWMPILGISYAVGIDGISLWLILMTTALMPLAILGSFSGIHQKEKGYYFLLLALQTGMIGAFVAIDLFLFYVFWEVMLVPMYFLIGIWGGKERIYAAMKFFVYTMVGSLMMLVAIFYLAYQYSLEAGHYSMLLTDLWHLTLPAQGLTSPQMLLFLAFALAFTIKVPLFPLHTWLPDAHVQAPTAGSVILAAILLKMGGYGLIRFCFPLFPEAVQYFHLPLMGLGAIAIVYGAWVAMVQPDMKKLVAYSSVSHMGYVILGIFSLNEIALTGSLYQMLNHGVSTGALFLLVGMIYDRRHTREISAFGGIAKVMPLFAIAFLIVTLSSVALPGTNGFIGEFLILLGAWKAQPWLSAIGGLGVIFGAVYMLLMYQNVMLGSIQHKENHELKDLNLREKLILSPLIVAIFVMGFIPHFFFEAMTPSIQKTLSYLKSHDQTSALHVKDINDGNS